MGRQRGYGKGQPGQVYFIRLFDESAGNRRFRQRDPHRPQQYGKHRYGCIRRAGIEIGCRQRDFAESDLERRIEEMRQARIIQNQWVKDYEEALARLQLEVDNVEEIKKALPDGCWKRLKLEP